VSGGFADADGTRECLAGLEDDLDSFIGGRALSLSLGKVLLARRRLREDELPHLGKDVKIF